MIYRTQYKQILSEFAFKEGTAPTKAVILCEGLPVAPKRQEAMEFLADQGFLVFYPRYRGTWESEGEFLSYSPTEDIMLLIELISSGNIIELFSDTSFKFSINKISVIGTSFGGSVALESSAFKDINKIVALSPIVDFKAFNTQFPEQDLMQLAEFMIKAFKNGYHFTMDNWKRLLMGEVINPAKTITPDNASKILIIQCQDDVTVNYQPVVDFANKRKIKLELRPTGGHFSFSRIPKDLWFKIIEWLN
jgi:esterase/lipase